MRSLAAIGACLLAVLAAGAASANSGVLTNPTGDTAVATFSLGQGDIVDYTWSSGFSVTMHIDRQGAGEVFNTTSQATTGSWTAPAAGQYTFYFRSSHPYNVISWDITPKTNPILFVAIGGGIAAAVVAVVAGAAISSRRRRQRAGMQPAAPQIPPPPQ